MNSERSNCKTTSIDDICESSVDQLGSKRGRTRCVSLTIDKLRFDVVLDARDVGKNGGDFRIVFNGVNETRGGLVTHLDLDDRELNSFRVQVKRTHLEDRRVELNDVRPNGIGLKLIFVHLNEFHEKIQGRLLRSTVILKYAVGPLVDHFRREHLRKESRSTRCVHRGQSMLLLT